MVTREVLGGFHTEMSFLNAIGNIIAVSGIEKLAVAAGSLNQAITGKHYNRAMILHKIIEEATTRTTQAYSKIC